MTEENGAPGTGVGCLSLLILAAALVFFFPYTLLIFPGTVRKNYKSHEPL